MDNALQSAIRNLEGKAKVEHDKYAHHFDRAQFHTDQANLCKANALRYTTAIDAIREVMPEPGSFGTDPMPVLKTEEPEAPAEPAKPFRTNRYNNFSQTWGNGAGQNRVTVFDRDVIKRELRARHIYYPLAPAHRRLPAFIRQSLIAACIEHPGYDAYVDDGGYDITKNESKQADNIRHAIKALKVDVTKVSDDAKVLHSLIYASGVEGEDYR